MSEEAYDYRAAVLHALDMSEAAQDEVVIYGRSFWRVENGKLIRIGADELHAAPDDA